jgi:predicted phosphodiesterase
MSTIFNFTRGKYARFNDDIEQIYSELYLKNDRVKGSRIAERIIKENPDHNFAIDTFSKYVNQYVRYVLADREIVSENVRLAKKAQKHQDLNRIQNKGFREHARLENALEAYNESLVDLLRKNNLSKLTRAKLKPGKNFGIFHFTDQHFNELVSLDHNRYDFDIASRRCKLMVDKATKYFKASKVDKVLFAHTGDVLNSDRRLDEKLNMSTNRSRATFLAVDIIQQMLLDLNKEFDIQVAYVTGNESRVGQFVEWTDIIATDNYDFTVYEMLRRLFEGSETIYFVENAHPLEQVVLFASKNILLLHGNQQKCSNEKDVQQIIGKWAKRGIAIDFVLFGHIHSCYIGDYFARGASLVGANAYSDDALQLVSAASQNIHIVNNQHWDSIRLDLQDVEGVKGYNIDRSLEAYNAKSADKAKQKHTIIEITI